MTAFPFQTNTGFNQGQNPTLLPNLDRPYAVNGVLSMPDPLTLAGLLGGNVPAAGDITIGGTAASGDVVTVTIALGRSFNQTLSYTLTSSDTVDTVAYQLGTMINADLALGSYGFYADADGAVVKVYQRGPTGNFATITTTVTGSITATAVQMAGGSGSVVPMSNFTFSYNGTTSNYRYGLPYVVTYDALKLMAEQGVPIS